MTLEITISVPDKLGQALERFRDRLPEALERGLHELVAEASASTQDEGQIVALLASRPSPEQVMAIHPSPELQARVDELLAQGKRGVLTPQEQAELERYFLLEHLVRVAKAQAYRQLHTGA